MKGNVQACCLSNQEDGGAILEKGVTGGRKALERRSRFQFGT